MYINIFKNLFFFTNLLLIASNTPINKNLKKIGIVSVGFFKPRFKTRTDSSHAALID